jgi:uncharacterized protein DUF4932
MHGVWSQPDRHRLRYLRALARPCLPVCAGILVACGSLRVPTAELPEDRDTTRVRVLVPESFELANIIMSLTEYAVQNRNLIYRNTEYYQRVQSHFGALRGTAVMRPLQLGSDDPLRHYYEFRENSAPFGFVDDRLVHGTRYSSWWSPNLFAERLKDAQAFADLSSFRAFYAANLDYYAQLIARYRDTAQIDSMIVWLEHEFSRRYDYYTVFFSPLIYGSHSANNQRTQLGDEVLTFVAGPDVDGGSPLPAAVRAGLVQRILFTEIDHLFVNPVSTLYRTDIDRVFGDRARWTTDNSSFYTSPSAVFNEYMTWSIFFLFVDGRMPAADFDQLLTLTTQLMEGSRRFIRFGDFNRMMLQLWRNRASGVNAADLYPAILQWARTS